MLVFLLLVRGLCAGCDPNVTGSVNRLYMGYLHVFASVIVYALFETGIYVCVGEIAVFEFFSSGCFVELLLENEVYVA